MKYRLKRKQLKKTLPYLALFAAHLIWGANFVVSKLTLSEFPVMTLAFFRFALAGVLIIPFLMVTKPKNQKLKISDVPLIFLIGILMVTFNIAFFYEGILRTTAMDASILTLAIPVFSVIGAWMFLKEHIYWINLVGVATALIGAMAIVGIPFFLTGLAGFTPFLGNILILLSTVCFVAGSLLSKKILENYSPLLLSANLFLIGSITFFIPAIIEYKNNPSWILHVSVLGLLGFLFITVMSTVCAYFLLAWGISKIELFKANLIQYIEPVVTTLLAASFLSERISFTFIIGSCLIILGVYWGTLGKQHHFQLHQKSQRI